jgi:glycine hydroxymethyltransferase
MNTITAIAVALKEAQTSDFLDYAQQTLKNTQILAIELLNYGYKLVTGGTDNHMVIMDFSDTEMNGSIVESTLDKIGISTSKSTIPDDPNPPFRPSGLRIGMPAMTTRGVKENGTKKIASFIHQAILARDDEAKLAQLRGEVKEFCTTYPVPSIG